jgi:peroxiredoxin
MDRVGLKRAQQSVRTGLSVKAILGIAALTVFTILITWRARVLEFTLESETQQSALVNKLTPDFSASTLDGRTLSLADFRGQKKLVIAFWASWCAPCRVEMPALVKFYRSNHGDSSDFEILAVSIDEDTKAAADFATALKVNFPVLLDPRQKMADAYQVDGIPMMFVIDKDGNITYGRAGYTMAMEFELARQLGIDQKKSPEGAPNADACH